MRCARSTSSSAETRLTLPISCRYLSNDCVSRLVICFMILSWRMDYLFSVHLLFIPGSRVILSSLRDNDELSIFIYECIDVHARTHRGHDDMIALTERVAG